MDRPRRVFHDIDYKVTRDIEKEKEKDNNLDPFGYNDNDFLNPVVDNFEEEPKKAEPKKVEVKKAEPKVDKKAFVERKLKAINSMSNAFLAKRQAERLMSRR